MVNVDRYKIKKADIDRLKIPPGSRMVLIRIDDHVVNERTPSGIWKIADTETDWQRAVHSDRTGVVVKVPRGRLPFKRGGDLMPWKCNMELGCGMTVIYDFLEGENSLRYVDEEGAEYRLIPYDSIYLATFPVSVEPSLAFQKTDDGQNYVIPLNGFHIFEIVYHEAKSKFDIHSETKINQRMGIVKYLAKNNLDYENGEEDHVQLQVGDKVRFNNVPMVTLEDEAHCHFDGGKMYRRAQARNVDLVWRGDQLILPDGRLLVDRIPDEDKTPGGVILVRHNVKNHRGKVVLSSLPEAKRGRVVKYVSGAGVEMEYREKKVRLMKESEVLYVE